MISDLEKRCGLCHINFNNKGTNYVRYEINSIFSSVCLCIV